MTTELRQPPINAKLDDWVWKQWFQTIWKRVLEFEASNILASGIPVDNQIAVWNSASTLEGDANFLWNGTNLIVGTTADSNLNETLRVQGAGLFKIPTAGLPSTSDTDTSAAVGVRVWTGGAWALDLGNNNGLAWIQNNTISAVAPTTGELILNPRGGVVGVGYTTTPPQLFSVNGTSYFVDTLMTGGKIGVNISAAANVKTKLHTYHTTYDWPDSSSTLNDEDAANLRVQGGNVAFDVGTHSTGPMWIQVRDINNFAINYPIHLNPNGGRVIVNSTSTAIGWASNLPTLQVGDISSFTQTGPTGNACLVTNNLYYDGANWRQKTASIGGSMWYFSGSTATFYNSAGVTAGATCTLAAPLQISTSQITHTLFNSIQGGNESGQVTTIGIGGALEIKDLGTPGATQFAGITFHNSSTFAANFGLQYNELVYGGWSLGAVSYRVHHEGLQYCNVYTTSSSSSIFGSAANYNLNVNGTAFVKGLYSLGTGASEIHRNISGSGAITSAQSALQVGLQSTTNGDSCGAGGGPSLLFFGYDNSNPPTKQFVGRIGGIFESGTAGNVYGGVVINVRTNHADSNAATVACTWKASKNMVQEGYTQLGGSGAPAVKMKKLTGTTASTQGAYATVAHGLTGSKIISYTCNVWYGTGAGMPPGNYYWGGYNYAIHHDGTQFVVANSASDSSNILSKSFTITVWYEE